jgi:hypothetical protein
MNKEMLFGKEVEKKKVILRVTGIAAITALIAVTAGGASAQGTNTAYLPFVVTTNATTEPLMLAFSDEAIMLIAQADNSWMTPEEAERMGVKYEPKPAPPPPPPLQIPKNEERDYDYLYDMQMRNHTAVMAVVMGALLPGGGSFYVGDTPMGFLHLSLQIGGGVGLGWWYGSTILDGGNGFILFLAILVPTISRIIDMVHGYNYALEIRY